MRFDYLFVAAGVIAGLVIPAIGAQIPAMKAIPALMWLLVVILAVDLIGAYIRGLPVMGSVPTQTRVLAFVGGAAMLLLSGAIW